MGADFVKVKLCPGLFEEERIVAVVFILLRVWGSKSQKAYTGLKKRIFIISARCPKLGRAVRLVNSVSVIH